MVRLPEEEAALLNAAGDQVVDGGDPELPAEGVGQVIFIQVGQLSQLVQAQVLLEVIVDVPPDQTALPAGPGVGGLSGEGGVPLAVQPDQHHLQKAPADPLVARKGGLRLLEHQAEAAHQLLPAGVEVEQGIAFGPGQGLQALHPQDRVLQGAVQLADLRVGHVGVDDDRIVDGHGKFLLPGAEAAVAPGDEEQLGAAVGVEAGVPLGAVLSPGDVGQPGRSAGGGGLPLKGVLALAHGHSSSRDAIF